MRRCMADCCRTLKRSWRLWAPLLLCIAWTGCRGGETTTAGKGGLQVNVSAVSESKTLLLHLESLEPKGCVPPADSGCQWVPLPDLDLVVEKDPGDPHWTGRWEEVPAGWLRISASAPGSDFRSHPQEMEFESGKTSVLWLYLFEQHAAAARHVPAVLSVELDAAEATPGQRIRLRVRAQGVGVLELTGSTDTPQALGMGLCQGASVPATIEESEPIGFDPGLDERGVLHWIASTESGEFRHPVGIRIEDETGSSATVYLHIDQIDPCSEECDGVCVDLCSDAQNCGACDNVCPDLASGAPGYCGQGQCNGFENVAGGIEDTCAVTTDGRLVCWGRNLNRLTLGSTNTNTPCPHPTVRTDASDILQVELGGAIGGQQNVAGAHLCVIHADRRVSCAGRNTNGQIGRSPYNNSLAFHTISPSSVSNAASLSLGANHSCALLLDRTVKCWGHNADGQVGYGGPVVNVPTPQDVGLTDVVQVAAGRDHSCALVENGSVYCWGANSDGQLGIGESGGGRLSPTLVTALSGVIHIGAWDHTCAVRSNGSVLCWGPNGHGQLGDDSTEPRNLPTSVSGLTDAVEVHLGAGHTCAVRKDGSVHCWGYNVFGQLGDDQNSGINSHTPVVAQGLHAQKMTSGTLHNCAIDAAGAVLCWGLNTYGQQGRGATGAPHNLIPTPIVW